MLIRFSLVLFGLLTLLSGPSACGEKPATPTPRQPSADKGRMLYMQVCAQCHGVAARGVHFLGADLKTSTFFNQSDEQKVIDLIVQGKPATADRPAMPPKGGRLNMTFDDVRDIIAYIHSLPGPVDSEPPPAGTQPISPP